LRICKVSFIIILALFCLSSCSGIPIGARPSFPSRRGTEDGANGSEEPSDPRARASLQLTQQGKTFLAQGKPDDAISVLERAVGLDPNNGQNYYYLAEAWIAKNNRVQAEEFNRLAGIYLEDNYLWMQRVAEQRRRIDSFGK
jgi:tetratricopeptide (TPR) repeat protein